MILFYSPGACSMSVHILLNELGLKYDAVTVDMKKKTFNGGDYHSINPKGSVPALQLDNGEVLTECAVILQYLADENPGKGLIPNMGTMERYRCMEWLNYISSEIHKGMSPFFRPNFPPEEREHQIKLVSRKLRHVAKHLETNDFVMGQRFTVADAYLFTLLNWTGFLKLDVSQFPSLRGYMDRMKSRPVVFQTMKEEGLLH